MNATKIAAHGWLTMRAMATIDGAWRVRSRLTEGKPLGESSAVFHEEIDKANYYSRL